MSFIYSKLFWFLISPIYNIGIVIGNLTFFFYFSVKKDTPIFLLIMCLFSFLLPLLLFELYSKHNSIFLTLLFFYRYSSKGLPTHPKCSYQTHLQCRLLIMRDVKDFHHAFKAIPEKEAGCIFINILSSESTNRQCKNLENNDKKPKPKIPLFRTQ